MGESLYQNTLEYLTSELLRRLKDSEPVAPEVLDALRDCLDRLSRPDNTKELEERVAHLEARVASLQGRELRIPSPKRGL